MYYNINFHYCPTKNLHITSTLYMLHPYGIYKYWGLYFFYKYLVPNGTVL